MKVILHTLVAGPEGTFHPGERDLPTDLALRLIDDGYAEAVNPAPAREAAITQPTENASLPNPKARRIVR